MAESKRVSGIVRWFSGQKGFGFIAPDGEAEGEDVFVHQTSIRSEGFRTLSEGEAVEFVIDLADDGRSKAVDVVSLSGSRFSGGGRGGRRGGRGGRRGRGGGGGYARYDSGYDGYDGYDGYSGGGYVRGGRGGRIGGGGRIDGGGGGGGACYNCGQTDHLARDCYENSGGGGGGRDGYGGRTGGRGGFGGGRGGYRGGEGEYTGGGRGRGRGRGGGKCYNCGEEGHFARECPNDQI